MLRRIFRAAAFAAGLVAAAGAVIGTVFGLLLLSDRISHQWGPLIFIAVVTFVVTFAVVLAEG